MSSWAGRGCAVLFGLSFALLLGEGYFRFCADSTEALSLSKVSHRWFTRHYRYNSMGVRDDRDYPARKPPWLRRISFIGDSFTAGHGVKDPEDRFANIIRRETAGEWEVHVLARNGLDTGQEGVLLEQLLHTGYRLDWVVLVYNLNDIYDLVPDQISSAVPGRDGFWVAHSYMVSTLYYRFLAARDLRMKDYFRVVSIVYGDENFERQRKRLGRFKKQVEAAGGRLAVVTFPFLHKLGPDYGYKPAHEKLAAAWAGLGVPHLDLLEAYSPYRSKELIVNRFDSHPNEKAHRIAADAILKFLRSLPIEAPVQETGYTRRPAAHVSRTAERPAR